jgi:hypothetical protein
MKLKRYKLSDIDQVLAELIQVGGETLCSDIYKLINPVGNKGELPHQWKECVTLTVYKIEQ